MTTKIYADYSAFLAREKKCENGVSKEFSELASEIRIRKCFKRRMLELL